MKALKTEAHTKWHIKTYYYLRLSDVDQIPIHLHVLLCHQKDVQTIN